MEVHKQVQAIFDFLTQTFSVGDPLTVTLIFLSVLYLGTETRVPLLTIKCDCTKFQGNLRFYPFFYAKFGLIFHHRSLFKKVIEFQ